MVINAAVNVPASTSLNLEGNWSTTANGTITVIDATVYLSGTWTNNGTITASGATLDLYDTWTNNGTITVDAASAVSLGDYSSYVTGAGDIWKNSGTLAIAPGAAVNLGDFFTTDELENGFQNLGADLNLSQYTVNLIGTLDNSAADNPMTGGILALTASTGPVYFSGQIDQGMITTSGSNDLVAASGTLDGVTLDGTLDMSGGGVSVMGGLTLDTDLFVSGGVLIFLDGSTVAVGPLVQTPPST